MTQAERVIVGGLLSALALTVPAFVFHAAPRFPGSLAGGMFGIAAAILFVSLLVYSVVKRLPWIKERTKAFAPVSALLTFHVYAGALGGLLGIVHSGHKFQSPIGIALVVLMLAVVASGFVGRYYLAQIGLELREQQGQLKVLRNRYDGLASAAAGLEAQAVVDPSGMSLDRLVSAIADVEFSVTSRESLKRALARWVVVHIVAAIAMYTALALHIWAEIYYGLRWLG